jgi:hypothetical protein
MIGPMSSSLALAQRTADAAAAKLSRVSDRVPRRGVTAAS